MGLCFNPRRSVSQRNKPLVLESPLLYQLRLFPCVLQPRAPKCQPKPVDLKTGSQQLLQGSSFLAGLPDSMETGVNAILEIMRSNNEKHLGTLKRIVVSEVRPVVLFPNCMLG